MPRDEGLRATLLRGAAFVALVAIAVAVVLHRRAQATDTPTETEVPVHVAKVVTATVRAYVDGFGTVIPEPAHDSTPAAVTHLASQVSGVIAHTYCVEGQTVSAGAKLFELDPRAASAEVQRAAAAIKAARASVEHLESQLAYDETELDRARKLNAEGLASAKDVHDAELRRDVSSSDLSQAQANVAVAEKALVVATTGRQLLALNAPIRGTVVKIYLNPGEAVNINPANVVADLVDLDRLVVNANLPATALSSFRVGELMELHRGEEKSSINASVNFVGLAVDERTSTVPVRARVPPNANLRPGEFLRLRLVVDEHANVLTVPRAAVTRDAEGHDVVAIVRGEYATQVPVKVGLKDGNVVEIASAEISEGDTVVTAGAYGLPTHTRVKITTNGPQ